MTETVVTAEAMQRRTDVSIDPTEAEAEGHQVALEGLTEVTVTVTVTSADGSRGKVYRVAFEKPVTDLLLSPTWTSLEWPGADGTAIVDALREGDVWDSVLVIYEWDEAARTWHGFFPGLGDIPGLNTLTTLRQGQTYWFAVTRTPHLDRRDGRHSLTPGLTPGKANPQLGRLHEVVEAVQAAVHVGQLGLDRLQLPALLAGHTVHLLVEHPHEVADVGFGKDVLPDLADEGPRNAWR